MSITTTPNMLLPVPVVGIEPGPEYAIDVNNCLSLVDSHNHSAGQGVQITPDGLDINADLSINSNNLTAIRTVRLNSQVAPLSLPADVRALYAVSNDLYFNDGLGNQIRITASGAVAGTPGSIANLLPPASATYVGANNTFVWQSNTNTSADMDAGSYILRNNVANSFGLTLSPPPSIPADYTIQLPSLPGQTSVVTIDPSGVESPSLVTLSLLATAVAQALVPTGTIVPFGGSLPPNAAWLICDGSAVSRTTYASLFAVIGTTFGVGDGSTTFNLPDARDRFLIGVGSSIATALGQTGGSSTKTMSPSQMPSHSHGVNDSGHQHAFAPSPPSTALAQLGTATADGTVQSGTGVNYINRTLTTVNPTGISIQSTGGGSPFDVMNPWLAVNYIIKA